MFVHMYGIANMLVLVQPPPTAGIAGEPEIMFYTFRYDNTYVTRQKLCV